MERHRKGNKMNLDETITILIDLYNKHGWVGYNYIRENTTIPPGTLKKIIPILQKKGVVDNKYRLCCEYKGLKWKQIKEMIKWN